MFVFWLPMSVRSHQAGWLPGWRGRRLLDLSGLWLNRVWLGAGGLLYLNGWLGGGFRLGRSLRMLELAHRNFYRLGCGIWFRLCIVRFGAGKPRNRFLETIKRPNIPTVQCGHE